MKWLAPLIILVILLIFGAWFCSKAPESHEVKKPAANTNAANANNTAVVVNANASNATNTATNTNSAANSNSADNANKPANANK
jgi:biopolymer transport protein ExbD